MSEPKTVAFETSSALDRHVRPIGTALVECFHLIGLFAIGAATAWAGGSAFLAMMTKGSPSIEDLLLLFIYLEIGAMVGIYFKTNHMPVRFLIYVAITALTRHLVGYLNVNHKPDWVILYVAAGVMLFACSTLLLRYASYKYPSAPPPVTRRKGPEDDAAA